MTVVDFSAEKTPVAPPDASPSAASATVSQSGEALKAAINATEGAYDRSHCDALIVEVSAEAAQSIAEWGPEEKKAATLVQGIYYKIAEHQGGPIFRQEASTGPNNARLFLYKVARPL